MTRPLPPLAARTLATLGAAAALVLPSVPAAAQVVDTRSQPIVGTGLGMSFGRGGATTVIGQSFTAPLVAPGATLRLEDFTFYFFRPRVSPPQYTEPATFHAVLQAFDGTSAVGPALFVSALQVGPAEHTASAVPYTFDVGGLAMTPGARYFAYILDDGLPGTSHTAVSFASELDYAGGAAYRGPSATSLEPIVPPPPFGSFHDIPFVATFATRTVTPEPATVALVGGGLLALAGVARRRRRAT